MKTGISIILYSPSPSFLAKKKTPLSSRIFPFKALFSI